MPSGPPRACCTSTGRSTSHPRRASSTTGPHLRRRCGSSRTVCTPAVCGGATGENHFDMVLLAAGVARIGAVPVMIAPANSLEAVRTMVERAAPRLLITGPGLLSRAAEAGVELADRSVRIVRVGPEGTGAAVPLDELRGGATAPVRLGGDDDLVVATHTSGTTGVPKLVLHTANTAIGRIPPRMERYRLPFLTTRRGDVVAAAVSFAHIRVMAWTASQLKMAPRKLVAVSDPLLANMEKVLEEHRPTSLETFPNVFQHWEQLVDERPELSAQTRLYVSTFDAVHPRTVRKFLNASASRFPTWGWGLGQSEITGIVANLFTRRTVRAGRPEATNLGWPMLVRLNVVDPETGQRQPRGKPGMIIVSTKARCLTYLGEDDRYQAKLNGRWWNSGDLGERVGLGRVRLLDRVVDMIPGISCIELESTLLERLDNASDVTILGVPGQAPVPVLCMRGNGWTRGNGSVPSPGCRNSPSRASSPGKRSRGRPPGRSAGSCCVSGFSARTRRSAAGNGHDPKRLESRCDVNWLPPALVDLPSVASSVSEPRDFRNGWFWAIVVGIALFWFLAYCLAVHRAHVDKRAGIPTVVVAINFSWEFVHSFVIDQGPAQRPANFIWFFFDFIIVYQVMKYGKKDFPKLSERNFRRPFWGICGYCAVQHYLMAYEFRDVLGMYSGVALNVGLSASFIITLRQRRSSAGQSVHIAVCKMLGSFLASLNVFIIFPSRAIVLFWFVVILVLDLTYVRMVFRQIRAEGRSPWVLNRPPVTDPVVHEQATAPAAPDRRRHRALLGALVPPPCAPGSNRERNTGRGRPPP
ncbi:transmembrane-type terpene cyclase [Streptomyces celluloflavus]|uniref:transmembrane-type terpene cyclase n=1 Tax=Streptomyces celluloflavus TaxID=58344 RepID=UPI00369A1E7A